MNLIIRLLITAATAYFLTKVIPGVTFDSFTTAIVFAIILAVLNAVVKPVLDLFGMPLTILTLGLFSLVINALVVLLADHFVAGMNINGFGNAFIFSIGLSLISSLLGGIFGSKD